MSAVALFGLIGVCAGMLGALVGLGGGILLVPFLTVFLKVPIHEAIAASIIGVVATSTMTAVSYVREELANMRLGITLETATTAGAVLGGLTAACLNREVLSGIFGVTLTLVCVFLVYRSRNINPAAGLNAEPGLLGGRYYDPGLKRRVSYGVRRLRFGLAASFVAGNISGLLGIGGGPIKVPVMTAAMGVPIRAAVATSNFMIGVTACASAFIYYWKGLVNPLMTASVAIGVTAGAYAGSRISPRLQGRHLTLLLIIALLVFSAQMILAAFGIRPG